MPRYDEHGRKIIASAAEDGFIMIDFSRVKDGWTNTTSDDPPSDIVVDWDADLARLPEQDEVPAIVDLRREKRIVELIEYKDDQTEAERRIFKRDRPEFVTPETYTLPVFLTIPDNPEKFRVDQLWPIGGNVLFAAPAKFGKSTMIQNLVRSMLDGEAFLGHFECPRIADGETILLVDLEMSQDRVRSELRLQNIRNQMPLHIASLRGRAKQFDITDPEARAYWVAYCQDHNVKTLILDPLAPLMGFLLVEENDNAMVNRFFQQLDEFKLEAGIRDMICAHHCGHSADWRPRGASRFNDWPDALWVAKIDGDITNPASPRLFYARGRSVGDQLLGPGEVQRDTTNTNILLFNTTAPSGISAVTQVTQHIYNFLFVGGKKRDDIVNDTMMSVVPPPAKSFVESLLRDLVTDGSLHVCPIRTGNPSRQPNGYWIAGTCPDHP